MVGMVKVMHYAGGEEAAVYLTYLPRNPRHQQFADVIIFF